ncbi:MAG TPA: LysR family transcriptional regulator [Polyangia bacterium]|nr:LysR family transcriptional regulator [Polyangia bacterium]
MELRHLRYFVTVAEEENVTRAARRLHISQPPLSRQMRDLERELGLSLFDRSANGVRLTEAGETFLADARVVLQRADEAVERVKAVARGKRGRLRVGHASGTIDLLRPALRSFSRTHPHVSVDLREMTSQGILRGLRSRTLDVAVAVPLSPRDFDGLTVENLGAWPIGVAVSSKHRFARLREVRLGDVAREPIVGRSRNEYPEAHAALLQILAPYTRSPNLVEEYDSFASLLAAVEAGRGVVLLIQVRSLIAGKRLVIRPLKPALPRMPIALAYRADGISAAAVAFLAAARAARRSRR